MINKIDRIETLKKRFFAARPRLTAERLLLATEAYKKYAGEAIPVFRAHVLAYVLDHMSVLIFDDELIVGNLTNAFRGVAIHPEYSSTTWIREEIDDFPVRPYDPYDVSEEDKKLILDCFDYWDGKAMEDLAAQFLPEEIKDAIGSGVITVGSRAYPSSHTTPDYKTLFNGGFRRTIERCREMIQEEFGGSKEAQEKIDFWNGCIIACEAVIRFANRYAALAEEKAMSEADEKRKAELLKIAENCRNVPENAPKTFYEALQFIFFVQLVLHIEANTSGCGFGRFDQFMYPIYKNDIDNGVITREEAGELLACFYLKLGEYVCIADHWFATSFAGYPTWQILMIGGQNIDGDDVTNDLTYLVLDVAEMTRLTQPPIALRIHKNTPEKLLRKAAEMIQQGIANPALFNDEAMIPIVLAKGGTMEEARDWVIIGCVEPHEGGGGTDGSTTGGYMNAPKCLELALHNGVDPLTGKQLGPKTGDPALWTSREDVMEATRKQLIYFWELIVKGYNMVVPHHMLRLPVMFASLVMDGCIETGMSVQEGGTKHKHVGTFFCGAANVADAIEAIDTVCFEKKEMTLSKMIEICDCDFEGYEPVRQMLLTKIPKFGNDNDRVDKTARDLINYCARYVQKKKDARGGSWCLSNLSQTLNISFGEQVGALPDGKKALQPLSDNASPAMGRDVQGPTSTINSVGKLDQLYNYDGTLFNLRFDPRGIQGENGINIIEGVIKSYFEQNGCHIQINVIDTETLKKAQEEPENYRDIVVRVAGYMAYFTELDKVAQDALIERTAHLD